MLTGCRAKTQQELTLRPWQKAPMSSPPAFLMDSVGGKGVLGNSFRRNCVRQSVQELIALVSVNFAHQK